MNSEFRNIPSVNAILECPEIAELIEEYSHDSVTELAREVIKTTRTKIQNGGSSLQLDDLALQVIKLSERRWGIWPKLLARLLEAQYGASLFTPDRGKNFKGLWCIINCISIIKVKITN